VTTEKVYKVFLSSLVQSSAMFERHGNKEWEGQVIEYTKRLLVVFFEQQKEIDRLKDVYQDRCDDIEYYVDALREIDTHIRSDKEPIKYIVETLKSILPEYQHENY